MVILFIVIGVLLVLAVLFFVGWIVTRRRLADESYNYVDLLLRLARSVGKGRVGGCRKRG